MNNSNLASGRAASPADLSPASGSSRSSIPDAAWTARTVAVWQRWTYGGFEISKATFDGPWHLRHLGEHLGTYTMLQTAMKDASRIAQGIEAAAADETRSGSAVGESPVGNADAPQGDPS